MSYDPEMSYDPKEEEKASVEITEKEAIEILNRIERNDRQAGYTKIANALRLIIFHHEEFMRAHRLLDELDVRREYNEGMETLSSRIRTFGKMMEHKK